MNHLYTLFMLSGVYVVGSIVEEYSIVRYAGRMGAIAVELLVFLHYANCR